MNNMETPLQKLEKKIIACLYNGKSEYAKGQIDGLNIALEHLRSLLDYEREMISRRNAYVNGAALLKPQLEKLAEALKQLESPYVDKIYREIATKALSDYEQMVKLIAMTKEEFWNRYGGHEMYKEDFHEDLDKYAAQEIEALRKEIEELKKENDNLNQRIYEWIQKTNGYVLERDHYKAIAEKYKKDAEIFNDINEQAKEE